MSTKAFRKNWVRVDRGSGRWVLGYVGGMPHEGIGRKEVRRRKAAIEGGNEKVGKGGMVRL